MRVHLVDPAAYTPPYDRALAGALGAAGADVTLHTADFGHAEVAAPPGVRIERSFYRRARGAPGSRLRRAVRLALHGPDMRTVRGRIERGGGVAHFQWLPVPPLDARLLPRGVPLVITAHDVLPREPWPGQVAALRRAYRRADAVVVHSEHGRRRLLAEACVDPRRVEVIHHGAFTHLADPPSRAPLPPELAAVPGERPVVLLFGLMRPYKGIEVALEAWRAMGPDPPAELWVVGRPLIDVGALRAAAPPGVRVVPRFVADAELPGLFDRASVAILPYREIDQSGVLFTALAFGVPMVVSDVGGLPEVAATGAAELVPAGDPEALRGAVERLLSDPERRSAMAAAARAAAAGEYSWQAAADRHLALYRRLGA